MTHGDLHQPLVVSSLGTDIDLTVSVAMEVSAAAHMEWCGGLARPACCRARPHASAGAPVLPSPGPTPPRTPEPEPGVPVPFLAGQAAFPAPGAPLGFGDDELHQHPDLCLSQANGCQRHTRAAAVINADEPQARPSPSLQYTPLASPWSRAALPRSTSTLRHGSILTARHGERRLAVLAQCQEGLSCWGQHKAARLLPWARWWHWELSLGDRQPSVMFTSASRQE